MRALRHVDLEFFGGEHALALAAFPSGDEVLHDVLGLADHLEVRRRVEMRARRDVRPADAYRLAVQVSELDQVEEVRLLVEHAADHHEIGPVEVRVGQRLGIAVDEADVPVLRQHRGDGDQPERRRRIFRADEFAGFCIVPERVRNELRIDHQNAAANRHVTPVAGAGCHAAGRDSREAIPANKARPTVTNSSKIQFVKPNAKT